MIIIFYIVYLQKNPLKLQYMAKEKDMTEFIPPTDKEIMLIQPHNVTFGQYSISEWQENLLVLCGEWLQNTFHRYDIQLFQSRLLRTALRQGL